MEHLPLVAPMAVPERVDGGTYRLRPDDVDDVELSASTDKLRGVHERPAGRLGSVEAHQKSHGR
jgi:hypothetical protein